ncbi:polyisoprenoid-binding protein [Saccharibacter sp. 17.LH.SD]|nr:polyisoprenoid-binding protein [Saccharibacter sp. 17.LH.SD]
MKRVSYAIALGIVACALSHPAQAQVDTRTSQVQSGEYSVESGHTQIVFSLSHFGFTTYTGILPNITGHLTLNAQDPKQSSVSVTIPMGDIQTTNSSLNDELKEAPWFNVAKYPNATFQSTSIIQTDPSHAVLYGNLTLHGVTRPEMLKVHFISSGINMFDKKYTVGFEASGTIQRSDFGVKMFVPYIGDEVQLRIAGAFEK